MSSANSTRISFVAFAQTIFSQITTSAIKGNSPAANDELLAKEVSAIREEAKSAFELSMRFWVK